MLLHTIFVLTVTFILFLFWNPLFFYNDSLKNQTLQCNVHLVIFNAGESKKYRLGGSYIFNVARSANAGEKDGSPVGITGTSLNGILHAFQHFSHKATKALGFM